MRRFLVYAGAFAAETILFIVLIGAALPQSVDVAASVVIDAPRAEIWRLASDFEGAFENSNPEHDGTTVLSDSKMPLRGGLRFRQREFSLETPGIVKLVPPPRQSLGDSRLVQPDPESGFKLGRISRWRVRQIDPSSPYREDPAGASSSGAR